MHIRHALHDAGFEPLRHERVSVYVHVPFCRTRCHYCAFYLETGYPPRVLNETLEGMVAESAFWHEALGHPAVDTLYIGGGTPSVIPAERLESFLEALSGTFRTVDGLREATIEVNPESVNPALVSVLNASIIDRISMGVQSLHDNELAVLGRRSNRATALRALEYLRHHFKGRLSVDVIVGTPGQTVKSLKQDLHELLESGIEHVSLYGLTVEDDTVLHQQIVDGRLSMPSHDAHEDLWDAASTTIQGAGLESYEVSNYAFPGQESVHNAAYWNLNPYLGIGPGAVGMVYARTGDGERGCVPLRLTGEDVFRYQQWKHGQYRPAIEVLSLTDHLFEHFMNGLRTRSGVNLSLLHRRFGVPAQHLLDILQDRWCEFSKLQCYDDRQGNLYISLPLESRMILDRLLPDLWNLLEVALPELTLNCIEPEGY